MSFPKVWMLYVSLIPSFFVPRLTMLMVLMTITWGKLLLLLCDFCCAHTSVDACMSRWPTTWSVYALLPQMRILLQALCSVCPLTSVWLCSGLTKSMLTLREIHTHGLWADFWQRQSVRVHTSGSNLLHLGPTRPGLAWADNVAASLLEMSP